MAGFVAGHRSQRFDCDGELQWIDVAEEFRGRGIAGRLLTEMAEWFVRHDARRVCVNVDPGNAIARRLYASRGAVPYG
jgi:ribosomal protein S18 acetylase RimI-like enzyme